MDGAIRGMERLDVVKVIRNGSHLDHPIAVIGCQALDLGSPVLEPNLDLSRAQSRNLSRKPLTVRCVWVRLLRKLAHQKPSLLVGKSEALHLPSLGGPFRCSLGLGWGLAIPVTFHHLLIL